MPVNRTQLSKKRKESEALASRIKHTGFEMFPCSEYEKRNLKYVLSNKENSGCYSECVFQKVKCDVEGILVGEWQLLKLETDCLKQEKEAAFAFLKAAQRSALESAAHIRKLEKQEKFLKSKSKDMVCHSLKTLNKLEEAEEKEKQEEEERKRVAETAAATAVAKAAIAVANPLNPFARIEVPLLLLKVWGDWDFFSKIPPTFKNS